MSRLCLGFLTQMGKNRGPSAAHLWSHAVLAYQGQRDKVGRE